MIRRLIAPVGLAIGVAMPAAAQHAALCHAPQDACQQFEAAAEQFDAAFNKHDGAAVAGLFANDAVLVPPGPTASGKPAIQGAFQAAFTNGNSSNHKTITDQIQAIGPAVWAIGSWSENHQGSDGRSEQQNGNWAAVSVEEGGAWKLQMLTWNVIQAAPGMQTAANPALVHNPAQREHLNQEGKQRIEKEGK